MLALLVDITVVYGFKRFIARYTVPVIRFVVFYLIIFGAEELQTFH